MTLRDASTRRLSATPFPRRFSCLVSAPKGIRTPVPALRGLRPSPLDDTATAGKISLAARTPRNPTVDLGQVLLTLNRAVVPQGAANVPRAASYETHPYEAVWKVLSYGLPEAPIIIVALIYTHTDWLQSLLSRLAPFYPYAVFGAGVLLGWRFHRSRLLFALLLLTLADRTLLHFVVGQGLARHPVVLQSIGVLLPLNLAALALSAERGVLTPPGLARFALILGQLALVAVLDREAAAPTAALLRTHLLPQWLFAWSSLADPALLAFFVAGGLVAAAICSV